MAFKATIKEKRKVARKKTNVKSKGTKKRNTRKTEADNDSAGQEGSV